MSTSVNREFRQSPLEQGSGEGIAYTLDTSVWSKGNSVTAAQVKVFLVENGTYTEKTGDVCSGSASFTGEVITLPVIHSLASGSLYQVEVTFEAGGQTFQPWGRIRCVR